MQSQSDVTAPRRGVNVEIVGDYGKWLERQRPAFERLAAAVRDFDAANIGITHDEMVQAHNTECPEIGDQPVLVTIENTLQAAKRGHRGWTAVRVGAGLSDPANASTAHMVVERIVTVRRTPSGGRSARTASRRRTATSSSRGSPRSEDDEPAPPRAASRATRIETLRDVDALFAYAEEGGVKRATCGYCGCQTRGVRSSVGHWFLSHPCNVDEELARHNRELIRRQGGHVFEVAA